MMIFSNISDHLKSEMVKFMEFYDEIKKGKNFKFDELAKISSDIVKEQQYNMNILVEEFEKLDAKI